jgi:hypothetical protein
MQEHEMICPRKYFAIGSLLLIVVGVNLDVWHKLNI